MNPDQQPIPQYTQGKSSQQDAMAAISAAANFWTAQSAYWVINMYENSQIIVACPPFSPEEVQTFRQHALFPMRFVVLHTDRLMIRSMMALEGLMMAAIYAPSQASSFVVSGRALLRGVRERMEAADKRIKDDQSIPPEDRQAYEGKMAQREALFSMTESHIQNVQSVAHDVRGGRLQMPVPIDPILSSKMSAAAFMGPDAPPGAPLS